MISVGAAGADPALADDLRRLTEASDEVILASPDASDLYAALRPLLPRIFLARCELDALEHLCRSWRPGDTTVCLRVGNGSVVIDSDSSDNPLGRLLPELPPERPIWIGHGSNTWKSDLNLAVSYRRTSGPADLPGASLGIPWMAGIPGTVGGWIKMNAGAFGHSISEALESVCIDGVWHPASSLGFAYRRSNIVGEIQDFRLRHREAIRTEGSAEFYLSRRHRFPARTFGSFFKNPPGDHAGRLLEAVGAKSLRVGGAHVWSEHANVIVFDPSATPSDILALSRMMQDRVFAAFGIRLEPEVCGLVR